MVHNPGPQDCEIKKMLVANEMKKRSMSGSEGGDTKKIFNDVMSEYTTGEVEIEIAYDTVKRTLQRKRAPVMPKSPQTPEELRISFQNDDIMKKFGMTKGENPKQFFKKLHESETFSYCIFASEKTITLMEKNINPVNRHFLIDATFKVCPFGAFKQLLVIYIKYIYAEDYTIFVYFNDSQNRSVLLTLVHIH